MTAAVIDRRPVARPRPAVRRAARRRVFLVRRLAVAAVTVVLLALAIAGAWAMASEASSDGEVLQATVVVGPGETVWDVARDYAPEGMAPQAYVAEVLRHNDVDAAAVMPGTALQLPRP